MVIWALKLKHTEKLQSTFMFLKNVSHNNDFYVWKTLGYPIDYADIIYTAKTNSHCSCPQFYFTCKDKKWLLLNIIVNRKKFKKWIHITKNFLVIFMPSILLSMPVALTHYSHKHKNNGNILCVSSFQHITTEDYCIAEFCTGEIANKSVESLKNSRSR